MSRRKKGQIVNGWICLDKPFEMGSTEAVSKIRRLFDAQKAGHAGTLDPLASGILPIALGEATKTVPFMVEAEKVYRFTMLVLPDAATRKPSASSVAGVPPAMTPTL